MSEKDCFDSVKEDITWIKSKIEQLFSRFEKMNERLLELEFHRKAQQKRQTIWTTIWIGVMTAILVLYITKEFFS